MYYWELWSTFSHWWKEWLLAYLSSFAAIETWQKLMRRMDKSHCTKIRNFVCLKKEEILSWVVFIKVYEKYILSNIKIINWIFINFMLLGSMVIQEQQLDRVMFTQKDHNRFGYKLYKTTKRSSVNKCKKLYLYISFSKIYIRISIFAHTSI